MSEIRTRNENACRNIKSNDGTYSARIRKSITDRLIRHCEIRNINKKKFVEEAVCEKLDREERKTLEEKSKEELIELLLRR